MKRELRKVLKGLVNENVKGILITDDLFQELKEMINDYERLIKLNEVNEKVILRLFKSKEDFKLIIDKMEEELRNEFDILYCNPKSLKTFRSNESLIKHELLNRLNYFKKVR